MGVHSQRQKKRKAFQMATLFIPSCLPIITVNPSQLFSSGTFVAKGKLKKFNCVDAPLGASLRVSGRSWLQLETASLTGTGSRAVSRPRMEAPGWDRAEAGLGFPSSQQRDFGQAMSLNFSGL